MWVARSLPPLLSRLRRPLVLLGGTTRAYASAGAGKVHGDPETWPELCNSCGAKQEQRRRHLYVALDNWKHGFSLHKINSEDLVGGGDDVGVEPRRLPDPVLRFGSSSIGSHPGFHALGSNIVVTTEDDDLTLTYDTETAGLRTGMKEDPHEQRGFYHAVAAGNNLYTFDSDTSMLNLDEFDVPNWEGTGCSESPFAPHKHSYVSACALHPDGRTIFVSLRRRPGDYRTNFVDGEPEQEGDKKDPTLQLGTFSLDTADEWGRWTWHGGWCLPFEGQAHYDGDLGAWVGTTHAVRDGDADGYRNDDHEHLCSYDPPDLKYEDDDVDEEEEEEEEDDEEEDEKEKEEIKVESAPLQPPPPVPRWSLAPEKLTFLEPKLKSTGRAVLLHTGGRGTFCLVERALRKGVRPSRHSSIGDGDDCLLRVTMCRIRYGRDGKLVAAPLSPSRSYLTSRYVADFDVRAFWI